MIVSQTTECLPRIVEVIARGGVIAFRTDTFYGLGADPFNRNAVQKIKELKGREANKPILIVISDLDQLGRFIVERRPVFDLLASSFWPGAVTLIGAAVSEVPAEVTAGTETVGVRLPDDDRVRRLVRACGGALTATSANPSGQAPARRAEDVDRYFGKVIDLIIDDGRSQSDEPSTIIDVTSDTPKLVRAGAVSWSRIQTAINQFKGEPA